MKKVLFAVPVAAVVVAGVALVAGFGGTLSATPIVPAADTATVKTVAAPASEVVSQDQWQETTRSRASRYVP
jgi:hypothetical protein